MKTACSNYDKMKNAMADSFLRYDQTEMIRRFSLRSDAQSLYIVFAGRQYRIDRTSGRVQWQEQDTAVFHDADYNETMTIYDVLCGGKRDCRAAGTWISINEISTIKTGNLEQNSGFFQQTGDFFRGRVPQFCRACEALGGEKQPNGDAAYKLELFPFLPILLRFWDADEEFPASLQILVDRNTLDFMHYETLMFALNHVFRRLKEEIIEEKT